MAQKETHKEFYRIIVGEVGNSIGHLFGVTRSLHGARVMAEKALSPAVLHDVFHYDGDGWAVIRGNYGYEERRGLGRRKPGEEGKTRRTEK